jgi:RND superfamily putative drug exporter
MATLGRAAWWTPSWLDKVLPNLDIEGDRLAEYLRREEAQAQPVATEPAEA